MIGRNFSVNKQRAKYALTDFVMVSLAFFLFNIFRYYSFSINFPTLLDFICSQNLLLEQLIIPFSLLAIFWLSGYYNNPFNKSRVSELTDTFWSVVAATIFIYLLLLINDSSGEKNKDYQTILMLFSMLMVFVYLGRFIHTSLTIKHLKNRHWIYRTLIIGNSRRSRQTYRKLMEAGSVWAYDVVGFVRFPGERDVNDEMPCWNLDQIESLCEQYNIDQIILCPDKIHDDKLMNVLDRLFPLNKPVKIAPDTLSFVTANIRMNDILGIPFVDLTSPRISEFQKNVKRTFDVVASSLSLILLSPVFALIAIIVKSTSEGPVIYTQERIGRGYKKFLIYKFRSMRKDAEKDGPRLSNDKDDRITPVGRIMRKYRIDEFPQFWNVLKGDMSLVGPRPEREFFIEQIIQKAPYYGLIFQVRPGITSWGMVKYGYASSIPEMVARSRYDLVYLNNMSISSDIKIMIYTIRTVIKGSGV